MVAALGAGVAVLGALHVVLHLNHDWFDALPAGIGRWLDMNSESSLATWYNVSLLVLVAAAAALASAAQSDRRDRWAWGTLAVLVGLLSVDEKIQVHERLPALIGMRTGSLSTHEWLVPGGVLAGLGVIALVLLMRHLDRRVRRGMLLALMVYATGALVVEGLTGLAVRTLPIEHPIRVGVPVWELIEESLEMFGCIIAFAVVLSHLERSAVLVLASVGLTGVPTTPDTPLPGPRS